MIHRPLLIARSPLSSLLADATSQSPNVGERRAQLGMNLTSVKSNCPRTNSIRSWRSAQIATGKGRVDHLEIHLVARLLLAEEHGGLRGMSATMKIPVLVHDCRAHLEDSLAPCFWFQNNSLRTKHGTYGEHHRPKGGATFEEGLARLTTQFPATRLSGCGKFAINSIQYR